MLHIQNLTYRIGDRLLLDRATVQITDRQRAGLIGRNGTGKSTLIRLILSELEGESGGVTIRPGIRVGHLPQEAPSGSISVRDYVLAADQERATLLAEAETSHDANRIAEIHAHLTLIGADAAPSRAATILAGLGFDEPAQAQPLSAFSGGWRMRAALAAQLFTTPELLLLDEPSNHLDFETTLWLVDFLRRYPGTLLVVSHDRDLLNAVATHILHLEGAKLALYTGNYDTFERLRREQLERNEAMRARQADQRQKLQSFVDRFRAKASKARQAQSRLKMLAKLQPIAAAVEEDGITFRFPEPDSLAPPIFVTESVSIGYAPEKPVLRNLNLRIDEDDRIALLGQNGNGKSTLAKFLAGKLAPLDGEFVRASKLRIGYFGQHQIEELDPNQTAYQQLAPLMPNASQAHVRARLGGFGLPRSRAETPARQLSGGEKARLVFALITVSKPHLLILDEPTNHLDIDTREALIQALADFNGAAILISHDRHLVEATADQLWLVSQGSVRNFEGDLDDYQTQLLGAKNPKSDQKVKVGDKTSSETRQAQRRTMANKRDALTPLKQAVRETSNEVEQIEKQIAVLEKKLADPTLYNGPKDQLSDLVKEQGILVQRLKEAENRWLAAEEALTAEKAKA